MSTPADTQRRYMREPARRAFAAEVREVRLTFKDGENEKSPVYVMLPSGVRCNRLFFCGQVTRKELKGEENTFYSVRVQDPTGIFFVSAGIYQPEAKQQISRIDESAWVAVVGKAQARDTPDGATFVSIRAEAVAEIDEDTYRKWVDETAAQTLDRADAFGQTDDSRKAQEFYANSPETYRQMALHALQRITF
ncbi:nucleic acid-binding protein [Methanogenium sp. S4BF]|uniref:nucleic acid-binding protein n=1 Tax=Methanogenium sp. S4BF TaxID=1789226 RepID=UPI0024179579|nr:nucleic acid-binding protein [Methanogenium sp. S4BF]WFN34401.1 nucleic acid-binding protein [Methanogenium sp. S4BF]